MQTWLDLHISERTMEPIREPSGWRDRPSVGDAPPDQLGFL